MTTFGAKQGPKNIFQCTVSPEKIWWLNLRDHNNTLDLHVTDGLEPVPSQ